MLKFLAKTLGGGRWPGPDTAWRQPEVAQAGDYLLALLNEPVDLGGKP
jgi:hypothetical protein